MFAKSCGCGRIFFIKEWLALPFVGVGIYEVEDGDELVQESRNCPCGSTLARNVAHTKTGFGRGDLLEEHGALLEVVRAMKKAGGR